MCYNVSEFRPRRSARQGRGTAVRKAWKIAVVAAVALIALGGIVSAVLAHYIGGFFRTVEREAQDEEERRDQTGTGQDADRRRQEK